MKKTLVTVINSSSSSISIGESKSVEIEAGKHDYSLSQDTLEQLLAAANAITHIEVQLKPLSESSTVDENGSLKLDDDIYAANEALSAAILEAENALKLAKDENELTGSKLAETQAELDKVRADLEEVRAKAAELEKAASEKPAAKASKPAAKSTKPTSKDA